MAGIDSSTPTMLTPPELQVHYLPELTHEEKSKAEYSVNGIPIKDLLAEKSTFSREEIRWMIDSLENCKVGYYSIEMVEDAITDVSNCRFMLWE
jgi:hypothetical protein